jgi:DNA-binding CsgD family transcriptional regulator
MPRKIIHQNWIYETGHTGSWEKNCPTPRQGRIRHAVQKEVAGLSFREREFIELYWFQGRSIAEIAVLLGRKPYKLECLNRRIQRKLKSRLTDFVNSEFGLNLEKNPNCIICKHPRRDRIDILLEGKKPRETFKRIIQVLKTDFGIKIRTPQIIIGHMKYHMREE